MVTAETTVVSMRADESSSSSERSAFAIIYAAIARGVEKRIQIIFLSKLSILKI